MLLKNLIKLKTDSKDLKTLKIKGISLDSRKVKKGNLFFAIKGNKFNGEKFINEAIKKGARVVIYSSKKERKYKVTSINVKNIKETLSSVCSKFFNKKPKNIIAVTGTNGKSSVADFFYQILKLNKMPVASIGTLGIKTNKNIKQTNLTSLDIISFHEELAKLKKNKIDNVIIEASSHGLDQGRLDKVKFKAGIFTNFSQDHLDYHQTMKKYFKCKMILFSKLMQKKGTVITDSKNKSFTKIKKISNKKKLNLKILDKNYLSSLEKLVNLKGTFQIKNLYMSILAAKVCGLSLKKISLVLNRIKSVNGRLELIKQLPNRAKVFIDYAHTPEALEIVLKSLKQEYKNNLTLVFGCGGERDFKKRPIMAKIAKKYCEKIYVTDDNPRNENPKKIRSSITKFLKKGNFFDIADRKKAINIAIRNSKPFEIILVAGKGHEVTQDYGKKILKTSDKEIIKKIKYKIVKLNYNQANCKWNSEILRKVLKIKNNYNFNGVSINSKKIKKNNLFVAIKGKNNDGHKFVFEAIKKGARFAIISKKIIEVKNNRLINFKNTDYFLKKFAHLKRSSSNSIVIGVTGSSGKTTLKTMLGKLLGFYKDTYFSPKSFNNHYGVPLSLSNLEINHRYGVFEIGMSKKGEINKLSKLVRPHIGIITNVAEAHIENFKNIKGIAKAKSEIIKNIQKEGVLIINRDDKFFNYFNNLAKRKKIKTISFGLTKKADVHPISIREIKDKKLLKVKVYKEVFNFRIKKSNILNILTCLAVLKYLNLNIKKNLKNFFKLELLEGRGKIHDINRYKTKFKLVDESYNANPLSVRNAIINLSKIKKNNFKKYLLLGDMLELGKKSDFYHKNLSLIINNTDIDKVFVYGNKIFNTYKHTKKSKQGNILQSKNDFDEVFSQIIKRNDYLMIKGSNATGLNSLTKNIIKGEKNAF